MPSRRQFIGQLAGAGVMFAGGPPGRPAAGPEAAGGDDRRPPDPHG